MLKVCWFCLAVLYIPYLSSCIVNFNFGTVTAEITNQSAHPPGNTNKQVHVKSRKEDQTGPISEYLDMC